MCVQYQHLQCDIAVGSLLVGENRISRVRYTGFVDGFGFIFRVRTEVRYKFVRMFVTKEEVVDYSFRGPLRRVAIFS
jgi:hypothetical protein